MLSKDRLKQTSEEKLTMSVGRSFHTFITRSSLLFLLSDVGCCNRCYCRVSLTITSRPSSIRLSLRPSVCHTRTLCMCRPLDGMRCRVASSY